MWFGIILAAIAIAMPTGYMGAVATPITDAQKQLSKTQSDLNQTIKERDSAKGQVSKLNKELTTLRQRTIAIARQIQQGESTLSAHEKRLRELHQLADQQRLEFQKKYNRLTGMLAAMEQLSRRPNTSFFLHPGRPSDAVRSSMVLSHMIQELNNHTKRVQQDLTQLEQTRLSVKRKEQTIRNSIALLTDKKTELKTLSQKKNQQFKQAKIQSQQKQDTINTLSAKSKNLQDLITQLERESRRDAQEKAAQEKAEQQKRQAQKVANRPFPKKGGLIPPVRGVMTERYGQRDELGQSTTGIRIRTRDGAQVVAPYGGTVAFIGTYQKYGNMIIIKHPNNYYSILAGIENPDVFNGQQLELGEPIGIMGRNGPELYVEIRLNKDPRNPLYWISSKAISAQG